MNAADGMTSRMDKAWGMKYWKRISDGENLPEGRSQDKK